MRSLFDEGFGEIDPEYKDLEVQLLNAQCFTNKNAITVECFSAQNTEIPVTFSIGSSNFLTIYGENLNNLNNLENIKLLLKIGESEYPLLAPSGNFAFHQKYYSSKRCALHSLFQI